MLYERIAERKPVEKGWSGDRKYLAVTGDGERFLLRISPLEKKDRVSKCYFRMKAAEELPISMCRALEYGVCEEGAYMIQNWIEGADAEEIIPTLSDDRQYAYGLAAGRDLRKLHTMPAPADAEAWELRYGRKIDRKLKMYADSQLKYEEDGCILSYIRDNRHLIADRPVCYQHGDHHIGNMMVSNGKIVLIDFEKEDYGDPWEEFNRIVWSAQASALFASGIVDGYFDGEVPEQFWRLLALYICTNTLSSLPWAIPFGEKEIQVMREQQHQVLSWYDHMNRVVPSWYSRPVSLRPVTEDDREMIAALLADKVVGKTYMVPENVDRDLGRRLFQRYMDQSAAPGRYAKIICAGVTAVGIIHDVGITNGSAELGWAILSEHHGKGYCTNAVKIAISQLREQGFTAVTAGAFSDNPASLRVMEKCGMKPIEFREIIPYRGEDRLCLYRALDLKEDAGHTEA